MQHNENAEYVLTKEMIRGSYKSCNNCECKCVTNKIIKRKLMHN